MILDHLHVYLFLPQNFTSQSLFALRLQWHQRRLLQSSGFNGGKKNKQTIQPTTNKGRHKMMYLSQVRIKSPHVGMLQGTNVSQQFREFPGGLMVDSTLPIAGGLGLIPGQGTRSQVPQLKILHALMKTCSQRNLKKKKKCSTGI